MGGVGVTKSCFLQQLHDLTFGRRVQVAADNPTRTAGCQLGSCVEQLTDLPQTELLRRGRAGWVPLQVRVGDADLPAIMLDNRDQGDVAGCRLAAATVSVVEGVNGVERHRNDFEESGTASGLPAPLLAYLPS